MKSWKKSWGDHPIISHLYQWKTMIFPAGEIPHFSAAAFVPGDLVLVPMSNVETAWSLGAGEI